MAVSEIPTTGTVTLERAALAVAAARKKAEDIGVPMNIAVVDEGSNLKAFIRMENAWLGSIDIAVDKAYTARAFDMTTKQLAKISQPGDPAFGIHTTNGGRVVIFPGGIPLKVGDEVVGAVGVSGGQPDEDHEVAAAAVESFERRTHKLSQHYSRQRMGAESRLRDGIRANCVSKGDQE